MECPERKKIMKGKAIIAFLLFFPALSLAADSPGSNNPVETSLNAIRQRLSSKKHLNKSDDDQSSAMIAFTILPKDTHRRLSLDITGTEANEAAFKKIAPVIKPGKRINIPRDMALPALADPRLESIKIGPAYQNLWTLAKLNAGNNEEGLPATVRNIQRLNGITNPTDLKTGSTIFAPRSLLDDVRPDGGFSMRIRSEYSVADLKGLDRSLKNWEVPGKLKALLIKKSNWDEQKEPRDIDMVVIHTTENGNSRFSNVARYLQRERLTNYLIDENGEIYEIVPEKYRSFGCGQSLWEGLYAVDHQAINIEIAANTAPGKNHSSITPEQYVSLNWLLSDIMARRPAISEQRIVTHSMVALNYATGWRSRKGDPYEFDWQRAGLPDNSKLIDPDVRFGRAKLCMDKRYLDRVTPGQEAAARLQRAL